MQPLTEGLSELHALQELVLTAHCIAGSDSFASADAENRADADVRSDFTMCQLANANAITHPLICAPFCFLFLRF